MPSISATAYRHPPGGRSSNVTPALCSGSMADGGAAGAVGGVGGATGAGAGGGGGAGGGTSATAAALGRGVGSGAGLGGDGAGGAGATAGGLLTKRGSPTAFARLTNPETAPLVVASFSAICVIVAPRAHSTAIRLRSAAISV
jgi:hypothetical protein